MRPAPDRHIALFCDSLGGGGAERVIVTLANAFVRAGHRVDVVLVTKTGKYFHELDEAVTVVDLAAGRTIKAVGPLVRYLRRARPDAMLSTQNHVNVVAVVARILAGYPARLVVREAITVSDNIRHKREFKAHVVGRLVRWAYMRATRVIAPSKGVADDLVGCYGIDPAQIAVIQNPLDLGMIERLAQADAPEAPPAPFVIAVGRLNQQKDMATLIRAFARVVEHRPEVHLLILGKGEEREALQQLAATLGVSDRLRMPGFNDNPFAYLRRAAVFVLSSRYEGLPNTLLQALAVGTPVVATDCPSGPREALDDGQWGRLVPVGDDAAIADGILEGLDGGIRCPPAEFVRYRYDMDAVASRYLEVLLGEAR